MLAAKETAVRQDQTAPPQGLTTDWISNMYDGDDREVGNQYWRKCFVGYHEDL